MASKRRNVLILVLIAGVVICVATCFVFVIAGSRDPKIDISPQVVDLGIIDCLKPNIPERITFKIRNLGTDVLKLTSIHFTCACSKPLLDKDVLLPGEVAQLSTRFAVPNRIGEFRKKISVHSNDPRDPVKEIVVKGFMHRPCYVLPDSIVVNNLREGEEQKIELEVTGPVGDRSFAIREVSAANDQVRSRKIEKIGTRAQSSRAVWRITLTVASRGTVAWEDTIRISTSSQESPLLEVPVKVRELPPVRVNPALVILRGSADNETLTARVEITANTSKPVKIIEIEKPDWVDLHVETDVNGLLAKLHLKMREVPDKIKSGTQEGIVLKLGEGLGEVRIPILVLPAPAVTTLQQ